jgi:hypothetical protein
LSKGGLAIELAQARSFERFRPSPRCLIGFRPTAHLRLARARARLERAFDFVDPAERGFGRIEHPRNRGRVADVGAYRCGRLPARSRHSGPGLLPSLPFASAFISADTVREPITAEIPGDQRRAVGPAHALPRCLIGFRPTALSSDSRARTARRRRRLGAASISRRWTKPNIRSAWPPCWRRSAPSASTWRMRRSFAFALIRLAAERHRLVLTNHHIVMDGW